MNMEYTEFILRNCLDWILRTSVHVSLLIVLVFAVQLIFRRLLSPRWRYILWLLVALRMVMPALPSSNLSMFNLNRLFFERTKLTLNSVGFSVPAPFKTIMRKIIPPVSDQGIQEEPSQALAGLPQFNHAYLRKALFIMWLTGIGFLLASVIWEHYRFSSRVIRRRPITDPAILNLLEDCKTEMRIHAPINIIAAPNVGSPMLLGFIRPRLLLPEIMVQSFTPGELRYVLLHELGHLKRHDIAVNWLTTVLQILHWFNPLVWLAFHQMRVDREQACDAFVLAHVNKQTLKTKERSDIDEEKMIYGRAIIKLLDLFQKRNSPIPGLVGIMEEKKQMKTRMKMIAQFTFDSYRWSIPALVIMAIIAVVGFTGAQDGTPSAAKPQNLLDNPGFENIVNGMPSDWTPWASFSEPIDPTKVTFSSDTNVIHGGKASLCIRTKDRKLFYGCAQDFEKKESPAFKNGAIVKLTGYIKTESDNAYISVDMREIGAKQSEPEDKGIAKDGWVRHSLEFELAPGAWITQVHCLIHNINADAATGVATAWFDDLSLTITSKK